MRRLVKFEFLKLFTNKLFIYAFLIFLLVNVVVLFYTESKENLPYSAYKQINSELKSMSETDKQKFIENQYEKIYAFNVIQNIRNLKSNENLETQEYGEILKKENEELYNKYIAEYEENKFVFKYTGNLWRELDFLEELKLEYSSSKSYKQAVNNILEKADNLESLAIFKSNEDSFSNRSINDIAKSYANMGEVNIDYQVGKGLNSFIKISITEVFVILLIFVISSIIVFEEKEKNLFTLIRSTKNGRFKTMLSKAAVLFISVIIISLVMHSINLIYYGVKIGFGDLGASIQSVKTFMYSLLEINIFEYILLFLGTKIIVYFIIGLIVLLISIFSKNNVTTYLSCIILFLICLSLYTNIDAGSKYNVLKYVNLFNLLQAEEIYKTYLNLQIGPFMQDMLTLSIIFAAVLLIGLTVSVLVIFCKKRDLTVKESSILNRIKGFSLLRLKPSANIFGNECYKLFITNKVFMILVFFIIFQMYNFNHTNTSLSFGENIYRNYMEILEGELTTEKSDFIEREQLKYIQAEENIAKIEGKAAAGEISRVEAIRYKEPYEEILGTKEIFSRVEEKYEYIKENPDSKFVYDTGYKKLLRADRDSFIESDVYLLLIGIVCFTSIFVMEYRTGAINLLNTTPKGRKYTAKRKIMVCLFAGLIGFIISVVPEILKIFQVYGNSGIMSSITSLSYFNNLPPLLSICDYIVIMYVMRFASFLSILMLVLWVSLKMKNTTYSILAASSILLIPVILYFLGLEFAKGISVIPILNISELLAENSANLLYLGIPIMLGVGIGCKICKQFK